MTPALLATLALAIAGDRRATNELRNRLGVTQAAGLPPWPRWLQHALHGASPEAVILAFDFVVTQEPGYWQGWREWTGREALQVRIWSDRRAHEGAANEDVPLRVLQGWLRDPAWIDNHQSRTWEELQEAFPPDLYGPVVVGLSVAVDRLLKAGQPGVPTQATWVPTMGNNSIWPPTMQVPMSEAGRITGYTPAPPSEDLRQILLVADDAENRSAALRDLLSESGRRVSQAQTMEVFSRTVWLPAAAQLQPFTSIVSLPGATPSPNPYQQNDTNAVLVPLAKGEWKGPWESGNDASFLDFTNDFPFLDFTVLARRRLASAGTPLGQAAWSADVVLAWRSGQIQVLFIVDMGEGAAPIIERALLDRPAFAHEERWWPTVTRTRTLMQPWFFIDLDGVTEALQAKMRTQVDALVELQRMRPGFPQVGLEGLGSSVASVVRGRITSLVLPEPPGPGSTGLDPMRPDLDPYLAMSHLVAPINALPLTAWDLASIMLAVGSSWTATWARARLQGPRRGRVSFWRLPPMKAFIALAMFRMAEHRTTVIDFLVTEEGRAFLRTSPSTFAIQVAAEAWHRRLAQAAARERRERQKALALARAEERQLRGPLLSVETPVGPVLVYDLAPEDLEEEGAEMGHCVGRSPDYRRRLEKGQIRILSVRLPPGVDPGMLLRAPDPTGDRIFTMEVAVRGERLLQVKGPHDVTPMQPMPLVEFRATSATVLTDEEVVAYQAYHLSPAERGQVKELATRQAVAAAVIAALQKHGIISDPYRPLDVQHLRPYRLVARP